MLLTQKLAEFVINTSLSDVPREALEGARDALIDTIGCALAGTPEEVCRIVVRFLRAQGGNAQATVWGVGLATRTDSCPLTAVGTVNRWTNCSAVSRNPGR